jgi:ceramide glucosyltransferase
VKRVWQVSARYLILLPALAPLIYYVMAICAGWSYFRRNKKLSEPERSFAPPVSILKPVRGMDREAYENYASMCEIDYPEYEIVFAVAETDDPVIGLIEELRAAYPHRSIRLIAGIEQRGISRKTNSLCRLVKEAKHDLLVINDSDVRVDKRYLWDVVAPLKDPKVGVVTALFRSKTDGGFAAEVDAVGIPTDSSASTLFAWKFGRLDFAFGWTMATTKAHVDEIGGFDALINMHSDDFALGNELAKRGYRIELMRGAVWMIFPNERLRDFLKHELRWLIQLKNLRFRGYVAMSLTFGLAWALLVAALVPSRGIALAYFGAYVVLRFAMAWVIGAWGLGDATVRRKPWLTFVHDALKLMLYVASFFSNTIQWRGMSYHLHGPFLEPARSIPDNTPVRPI